MTGTAFAQYLKPGLSRRLGAVGLDVAYHRAAGDHLFTRDEKGTEVAILDMVGGFGASLLGHNHPEVVSRLRALLEDERPFHAQGTVRAEAGTLAARLSERVGRATGRDYVVTLCNSGAEAIEAALKHLEMEREARAARLLRKLQADLGAIAVGVREGTLTLPDRILEEAARRLGTGTGDGLDGIGRAIEERLRAALDEPPLILALEGAFHGKTTGAVQLTHNPEFRRPWRRMGFRVEFLPRDCPSALADAVAAAGTTIPALAPGARGDVGLVEHSLSNVGGVFVEPIQGEGGVRVISPEYLQEARSLADQAGLPLVIDEIQTGMGRTGSFLASEAAGVRGDYYTLAKALGGGLAKVAALLVDRQRWISDFDSRHTSTYADDDLSSAVANAAMDLLERDDDQVIRTCREKGAYLLTRLEEVARESPEQVADVRGRGLMAALELAAPGPSAGPLLRVLHEQDRLGIFLCGYLLARERIRVLPTLSAPTTLRIQPSAFITHEEIDGFIQALRRMIRRLAGGDVHALARHLAAPGEGPTPEPEPSLPAPSFPEPAGVAPREPDSPAPGPGRVAFLGHFVRSGDLRLWEPALSAFTEEECARFLARSGGVLDPFVVGRAELKSTTGARVEVLIVALPFTADNALAALREGRDEPYVELIRAGVRMSRDAGCSMVGLGGYTSILTRNCRAVNEPGVGVTSGNALTVAASLEALLQAADRLSLRRRRLGVVGAAGNIGAALAEVAAEEVDEVVLVGRSGKVGRLNRVAGRLYGAAWERARTGGTDPIARAVAATRAFREAAGDSGTGPPRARQIMEELGDGGPVRVAADMEALVACDLIVSATNAVQPVILPEHVAPDRPVIVSDVAVPQDVDDRVGRERPLACVLKGGMVRAPMDQSLDLIGLPQEKGELYGCVAETVLLGLAAVRENFSYGALSAGRVRRARELARIHGFEFDERKA